MQTPIFWAKKFKLHNAVQSKKFHAQITEIQEDAQKELKQKNLELELALERYEKSN